jgi:hypothetical protein
MEFTYTEYLCEAADDGKLRHLEHPEDRVIGGGAKGFHNALHTLDAVHSKLLGQKHPHTSVTTKYDGSPSLVFGHHPETGKFFVATKSAFAKSPKLNYTHADIVKNHEAGGLREKLHTALKHLPKSAPAHGVYQGDLMYTHHDIEHNHADKQYHFKPNTITYSIHKHTSEGRKIAKAKIGMVVHTQYHGKTLGDMKAHFNPDMSKFKEHPHVHMITPHADLAQSHYPPAAQDKYIHHMREAMRHHNKISDAGHEAIGQHAEHLRTYINKHVVEGGAPSVEGYKKHLAGIYAGRSSGMKSAAGKSSMIARGEAKIQHAHLNAGHLEHLFALHHHTQEAKNVLVHALSTHSTYGHSIGGKASKPEGFVVSHQGHPSKLVHRAGFSRANLSREKPNRFASERPMK